MHNLAGKHILIGVTGGIAAYKSPEIIRQCQELGAEVRVVMTQAATHFITPLTLQTLSGYPVAHDPFTPSSPNGMDHIELARWADCYLIAPATANSLANITHGLANDLVSALYLACTCPVAIAPAMNMHMWMHPATQSNIQTLQQRNVICIGPGNGDQACGDHGIGRMEDPVVIAQAMKKLIFQSTDHLTPRILISAGPTFEDIDPIRFIGNRSSGKMGYALANMAQKSGASVTLVSGSVNIPPPLGIPIHSVRSTAEMQLKINELVTQHDIFISAAAVADYHPTQVSTQKLKKQSGTLTLALEKTEDILKNISANNPDIFLVGFAAETDHLENNALKKLNDKQLDIIIANPIGAYGSDVGMDSDNNQASVYWKKGQKTFSLMSKSKLAEQLISLILEHYSEKNST